MAILALKAARGWNIDQTVQAFLIGPTTITRWLERIDEQGSDALVQLRQPVNRFPDFVRETVKQLKTLLPLMGKVRTAQVLARGGLHLAPSTVERILKEPPASPAPTDEAADALAGAPPEPSTSEPEPSQPKGRRVRAKYPHHVWNIDLTLVPTGAGLWVPLEAIFALALVALLLVGGRGFGSLFPPGVGI